MDRNAAAPRIYTATADGTAEGEPVLMKRETLDTKRREQGPYTYACQMLQNPVADETQGFQEDWLNYWTPDDGLGTNRYMLVDPASEKKKQSDYTAIFVIGLGSDKNYYILDMVRDRLNLKQRADKVIELHRRWTPTTVGYEHYGMQADIEYLKDRMDRENYRFEVTKLGGSMPKLDRIRRLIPLFADGRIYMARDLWKTDYEGVPRNLTLSFIEEEYKPFPVGLHDDMLDAFARIQDEAMYLNWPLATTPPPKDRYKGAGKSTHNWMTA